MIEAPSQVLNFEEIDYKEIEVEEVSRAQRGDAGLDRPHQYLVPTLKAPLSPSDFRGPRRVHRKSPSPCRNRVLWEVCVQLLRDSSLFASLRHS